MAVKRKENVSTVMLLPVVKINRKLVNNFYKYGFKNTYLFIEREYKFNVIHLLFEPEKFDQDFNEFIFELSSNPNYIETIDVGYKKVLVTFKIPNQFEVDFRLFLEGKYSKLSDGFKKCFPFEKPVKNERGDIKRDMSGAVVMEPSTFFHIFNRTEKLRKKYEESLGLDYQLPTDLELYDIVNIEKENLKNIILL